MLLSAFIAFYYNVLICYSLIYAVSSFVPTLPWTKCTFSWNTDKCCISGNEDAIIHNATTMVTKIATGVSAAATSAATNVAGSLCPPDSESPAKQYFK